MHNLVPTNTTLLSDQVRLNQILFNLLSNSVKFTHYGQIDVTFSVVQNKISNMVLCIEVRDTGIGISSENLETIFDPFTQSEKTSIREYGGSGLGLSIVKLLVEMLEGTIKITSEEHVGTKLSLHIPVEERRKLPRVSLKIDKTNSLELFHRQLSMLLVEDNKTNAYIAQAFCKKYGMIVEWVQDGVTAIECLKTNEYDLIMMDNQMPNMDGIEATQIIRNELHMKTPIIACTADGYEDTKNAFLEAGANCVLVKPIKEQPLREAFIILKNDLSNDL
ncbi:ATP-binding protein [Vibrio algarum]|uniref:histidine kinase n=1 Tax=Vibrio algarum TaxID=3020714 RepID=A0ABT4YYS0_9VIBR|nr:ATP-binding protein [Vibrio sp. KJ40-1]MDB1126179.1 ATP-binding protein [Vibrio sp. KJ40-1]